MMMLGNKDRSAATALARLATRIADELHPFLTRLAGLGPDLQGAVLMNLTARHLAGHNIWADAEETRLMREHLLELHVDAVRQLVPVLAYEIGSMVTHHE